MGSQSCRCGASVSASAQWCDLCLAPLGQQGAPDHLVPERDPLPYSGRPLPEAAARFGPGVHERIDWNRLRHTTLLEPTVTTFGWRGKLLITSPPYLSLLYFTFMLFGNPVLAIALGPPLLMACVWWTRQVWRPGQIDPAPAPGGARTRSAERG